LNGREKNYACALVIDWGPARDFGFAKASDRAMKKFCRGLGQKIQKNLMSECTKSADFLSRFSLMHMV